MSNPKPHPLARPVGYAVVLAALVALVFAAIFVVREATRAPRLIHVRFPEIATLGEGDAVVQGGVPVGKIVSIRLAPDPSAGSATGATDALVTLELFHHNPLARDAGFLNFSHSMMGARKVWILPGNSSLPLDESRVQQGFFAPGIAETLHKVDSLVGLIARLRDETERLLAPDNPLRSPLAAQMAMVERLDTATRQLDRLTGRLEAARGALAAARTGVRAAEPPTRSALLRAQELVHGLESVQTNLDTLLGRVEKVTALAADSTAVGKLLNDDAAYARLEQSVQVLEGLARLMRKDGLGDSLKIRPRLRSE